MALIGKARGARRIPVKVLHANVQVLSKMAVASSMAAAQQAQGPRMALHVLQHQRPLTGALRRLNARKRGTGLKSVGRLCANSKILSSGPWIRVIWQKTGGTNSNNTQWIFEDVVKLMLLVFIQI